MGTYGNNKQNKISMDVGADHSSSSFESVSFTSLVCIEQNQHAKSGKGRSPSASDQRNKDHDQEFEFRIPHSTNRNYHPDMGNSGGHLRTLDFLLRPAQPRVTTGKNKSRRTMVSHEDVENEGRREANGSKTWFGRKFFQSLVSPCRECRAVKPSMKAPAVPQKRIKLH